MRASRWEPRRKWSEQFHRKVLGPYQKDMGSVLAWWHATMRELTPPLLRELTPPLLRSKRAISGFVVTETHPAVTHRLDARPGIRNEREGDPFR